METLTKFSVPTREEVSERNQAIFDDLKNKIGFVPNLYAYYAKNETALQDYLALQGRKSTLRAKEREVVNLVVSEFNGCRYCQSAHTAIAKMNGFNDEQIIELRRGSASFDAKLNALAEFTLAVTANKGRVSEEAKDILFNAGYDETHMIDVVMTIGDKIISNYIHNLTGFEIDFPLAQELS